MKTKRVLSVLLSLVMILSMLPTAVIADETAAADAVVYFTVSNKGLLAADNDGSAMANREVTVTDIDADGKLTYHEALVAAHEAYNTQDGYVTESSDYGTSVTKLWGIDTTNTLFFANNAALTMGVGYDSIKDGDALVASVNKDNTYWADWYTFFDAAEKTVKADREFTLNLKGHLGMAYLEQDLADIPLEGISVGTWNDGEFAAFEGKVTDADGNVTLSFSEPGTYYVTADGTVNDEVTDWANGGATLETDCPIIAPVCVVNVEEAPAPTAITIKHNASDVLSDGRIVCQKGDKFTLTAYDQDGNETPVTWKNTSWGNTFTLDEATGEVEVTGDVYASTSYLYFTATSTLDETVSQQITIQATGFVISEYMKSQTVALSTDGQTAKTASLTGGLSGHNIWSYDIPEGVAQLAAEPGTSNTIKFNVFRPGTINVAFKLDINEELTDSGTITVTGVAVEDSNGIGGKTYLGINADNANPTEQLTAYVADGRTVASWASADETIAAVDENGLVTAKGVGSTIITATDSEGTQGGIKVVVESEEIPYFEALEFMTTALASGAWVKDETFAPTSLTYALPIKSYSTSTLTLQATTLYDTDKYTAVAEYTDINGEKQSVTVNSGKITTLANQPFDDSVMTITIADKNNADNNTVYTFNVSRPRDTTKVIKSNGGIALVPGDRALSGTAYKGIAEGAMQKADESGALTSGTGVSGTHYYYRTFIYDDIESFKLNLAASTAYAHIRYSIDGGSTWTETTQSGGATNAVPVPESGAAEIAEIIVQIIDDATYTANIKAEKDGFADAEPTEYRIWVDRVTLSNPVMLTAEVSVGDWYPAFSSDMYYYWLVVGNKDEAPVLTYTVAEGSTVKIGTAEQTVGDDGKYTVTLGTAQTSITVTSEDSNFTNTYKFGYKKKSALDVPDKVVDYLCIGSQYTNGGYGTFPEATLAGSLKSLGNFGGYITYYYEKPITDNPNNKYGMDFYVVGNSSETNIDSMAELGQVYVSEDGSTWYALAGSEHYENKAIWDYEITYTKGDDGKAYWTDNYGNSIDYAAKAWPGAAYYYMNDAALKDSYTFTGVLFESQLGNITGDSSSTASFAAKSKFGYADYYASNISGTALTDVNSYVENPTKANGFDVAWAVDENGIPIDVSEKEFHYIKVATASNIYSGSFAEKSTEVTYVVRTTAKDSEVGKTTAPTGVTISDGADSKTVNFTENQNVYSINLDNMKYVSVKVNGTADDDNIYINNQRVTSGSEASGFKVTKENGVTLIRVIVQNGDKEPVIYLLKLTSSAEESNELVESIKIDADGSVREAVTKDGEIYTASVGYRISSIAITPVADKSVTVAINGEELADSYDLNYGSNTFKITATDVNGNSQTVTLSVTRDAAPTSTGKTITVTFTLYGDEKHGDSEVHTYKNNKKNLSVWISQKSYTVDSGSTVLDVFEAALKEAKLTWENDGGNYITEIDGLSEFDNGPLSGWMYLLNGSHSDLGVAERTLKSGDKIVFHYTDDYTQEQGSESFADNSGSSSGTSKSGNNGGVSAGVVKDSSTGTRSGTVLGDFKDVVQTQWYYEPVKYVVEKGIMKGVSDSGFAPDSSMNRAMLVTVLHRLESEPQVEAGSFDDVPSDAYYAKAVAWASENGLTSGVTDKSFAPELNITREQIAVFLYRYAQYKSMDVSAKGDIASFDDADSISSWAQQAMEWAVGSGIINGSDGKLMAGNNATRAEVAAMLMRFIEK